MRAVIDTNVLISRAINRLGTPGRILGLLLFGYFQLVLSEAILAEYHRALAYPHVMVRHNMDSETIRGIIDDLRLEAILVEPQQKVSAVPDDPDDNKFIECALAGGADYIVTGDRHLLQLGQYEGIRIVTPAEFLAILEG